MRSIMIAVLTCACLWGQTVAEPRYITPPTFTANVPFIWGSTFWPPVSKPEVFRSASNFAVDLLGPIDTRPGCWGRADYQLKKITFRPPVGHRVRILRASGDLVSWARGRVPRGSYAGVLLGLQTTADEGSRRGDWLADNTMLYVQDVLSREPRTRSFDENVRAGGLLERDHVLVVKLASWLNDTDKPIHLEATLNLTYQWEKEESKQ